MSAIRRCSVFTKGTASSQSSISVLKFLGKLTRRWRSENLRKESTFLTIQLKMSSRENFSGYLAYQLLQIQKLKLTEGAKRIKKTGVKHVLKRIIQNCQKISLKRTQLIKKIREIAAEKIRWPKFLAKLKIASVKDSSHLFRRAFTFRVRTHGINCWKF